MIIPPEELETTVMKHSYFKKDIRMLNNSTEIMNVLMSPVKYLSNYEKTSMDGEIC